MVTNVIEQELFAVMISYISDNQTHLISNERDLSFVEAADKAIQAQGYFRFAIQDNPNWDSIEIEVGANYHGTVQLIVITRD